MADLCIRIRDALGTQSTVNRLPGCAAILAAKGAGGRDGNKDPLGIHRIEHDGMQAHPARARLP